MKIENFITEHLNVIESLKDDLKAINAIGAELSKCLEKGGKIMFCGNGGSASDSQHLAGELVGRFIKNRRALPAVALNSDSAVVTCISNDFGYEEVFSRQVEALGQPGDILVGISTSGQSENIVRAFDFAKTNGILTVSLLGKGGGKLAGISDFKIIVRSDTTARIQEAHILLGHIFCSIIEKNLGLS